MTSTIALQHMMSYPEFVESRRIMIIVPPANTKVLPVSYVYQDVTFELTFEHPSLIYYHELDLPPGLVDRVHKHRQASFRFHPSSGWTISGIIHALLATWVGDFNATHPTYGRVYGNFDQLVLRDSEAGYHHFVKHHPPHAFVPSREVV